MNHPRILHTIERTSKWNSLTQEDRKRLTVQELIEAMGELHCQHPAFKKRPRSLLPLPNLTGINGHVIEFYDRSLIGSIKTLLAWAMR